MKKKLSGVVALTALLIAGSASAGEIRGDVRGEAGGVMPGIAVTATGASGTYEVTANDVGRFRIDVTPGDYRLSTIWSGTVVELPETVVVGEGVELVQLSIPRSVTARYILDEITVSSDKGDREIVGTLDPAVKAILGNQP